MQTEDVLETAGLDIERGYIDRDRILTDRAYAVALITAIEGLSGQLADKPDPFSEKRRIEHYFEMSFGA